MINRVAKTLFQWLNIMLKIKNKNKNYDLLLYNKISSFYSWGQKNI